MKLLVKKHPANGADEAFVGSLKLGIFEQMTPGSDLYSFMTNCSHDKLTGDHYIAIGEHLNELNKA